MNAALYARFLMVAVFALAVWCDVRWPRLAPKGLAIAFCHVVAAGVVLQFATWGLGLATDSPARVLTVLVAVIVPAGSYCMLSALWLIKAATSAMIGQRP